MPERVPEGDPVNGGGSVALRDWFARVTGRSDPQRVRARMLDGLIPIFSQFGQDIFASDLVQMAIDCIASEMSKALARHIRTDGTGIQTVPASTLNRLLRFGPNPLMSPKDFMEKTIWLLYRNYNCFIYPAYDLVTSAQGTVRKEYTALYPLDPTEVSFLQDTGGRLFIRMRFAGGDSFELPYSDVIHLRKRFSVNSVLGGGRSGQPDNQALLKVLEINDTALQGLGKAVKTSLGVRGILKINTMLDDDEQKANRQKFEAAIASGTGGILPLDLKGDYTDLKPDPKLIDKDTMAFIQDKIMLWFGTPFNIVLGQFTDEEYQAFYERTLEPLLISLGQAFSRALFTDNELSFGNEIVFYQRDMMYLSAKTRLELLKTAGEQGLLTDNQKLALLGYPPIPGGNRRTISLNYISVDIADDYQMKKGDDNALTLNEKRKAKGLPPLPGGDAIFMPATMIAAVEADADEDADDEAGEDGDKM
jgi:HK97 family phage portal protein